MVNEDSQPLEVGKRYLAIRTHSSIAGTEPVWFSLVNIPLEDSRVKFRRANWLIADEGVAPGSASVAG